MAKETSRLPASRLYRMVTEEPSRILRLGGRETDLIAIRDDGRTPAEALMRAESPDLVIVRGKVKLISAELAHRGKQAGLQRLHVEGRGELLIDIDIAQLRRSTERALGSDLRLAGRRILA